MLSRSLSESDVSELCGSVKGPSPTDVDRDLIIGGHRTVAPSVGVGANDDGAAVGAYLGTYDDRAASLQPQPPRPVLPPKQRRGGGGGGGGFGGNDPPSQPNGGAQQRGGGGGGSAAAAVAPGNVAIGARL